MREIVLRKIDETLSRLDTACPTCGHTKHVYSTWFRKRTCKNCRHVEPISDYVWEHIMRLSREGAFDG